MSENSRRKKYESISYLCVIGMFMVMWPHLGNHMNSSWSISGVVQSYINTPFAIIQNFGAFGVCIFFIISGFLLYENGDSPIRFLIGRLKKIFLPLWCYTVVFVLFCEFLELLGYRSYWSQFSIVDWIKSSTLYCYLVGEADSVNGVLWYLFPLMMAYLAFVPFCAFANKKRFGHWYVGTLDILMTVSVNDFIPLNNLIGVKNLSPYIGIIATGYLIAILFDSSRRQNTKFVFALLLINVIATVYAFRQVFPGTYYSSEPYLVSAAYASLVFCIFILLDSKFKSRKSISMLASMSYPFYVQHFLYGALTITVLWSELKLPFTISFVAGVAVSLLVAYLSVVCQKKMQFAIRRIVSNVK